LRSGLKRRRLPFRTVWLLANDEVVWEINLVWIADDAWCAIEIVRRRAFGSWDGIVKWLSLK
jgi:hypothetical protein